MELSELDGLESEPPATELDQWIEETSKKIQDKKIVMRKTARVESSVNKPKIPLKFRKRTYVVRIG